MALGRKATEKIFWLSFSRYKMITKGFMVKISNLGPMSWNLQRKHLSLDVATWLQKTGIKVLCAHECRKL